MNPRPPSWPSFGDFTRCGPPAERTTLTYDQRVRASFFLSLPYKDKNCQGGDRHRPQLLIAYTWTATDNTMDVSASADSIIKNVFLIFGCQM